MSNLQTVPSPREVYKFISERTEEHKMFSQDRFRPLSRWIGLYQ